MALFEAELGMLGAVDEKPEGDEQDLVSSDAAASPTCFKYFCRRGHAKSIKSAQGRPTGLLGTLPQQLN